MITLSLDGWSNIRDRKQQGKVIRPWLAAVQKESVAVFKAGLLGKHTGRIYGNHTASINRRNGEFPANKSGALLASLKGASSPTEAVVGTNVFYSKFLHGTKHMKKRRMSDKALREGAMTERHKSRGWVAFQKGK